MENIRKEIPLISIDEIGDSPAMITGSTQRDAVSYRVGERIIFELEVVCGESRVSVPQIKYILHNGVSGERTSGSLCGEDGTFTIDAGALDGAGVMYLRIEACDEKGVQLPPEKMRSVFEAGLTYNYSGAAIADFDDIRPFTPLPKDIDEFWHEQTRFIGSYPIKIRDTVELDAEREGFRKLIVQIECPTCADDTEGIAAACICYPTDASPDNRIGIRMSFVGYGGLDIPSAQCCDGMATVAVSPFSFDFTRFDDEEYKKSFVDGRLLTYDKPLDNPLCRMMIRNAQMSRFAREFFGKCGLDAWNGELIVAGGSQGGFQAAAVAAFDKHVTLLDIAFPWISDMKTGVGNAGVGSSFAPAYSPSADYISCSSFAHLIGCKTQIHTGLGDTVCPVGSVIAFYNELDCEKKIRLTQNMLHGGSIENVSFERSRDRRDEEK